MFIALKTKIWLTVLTIVLLFTCFTLIYFPLKQGESLLHNYNNEVQNHANTVALGVRIALKEQNYEGVQTAMQFVRGAPGFEFVSLLQVDTVWNEKHDSFIIKETVFGTYPDSVHVKPGQVSTDSIIIKRAPFQTPEMSGDIEVGFSTKEIIESKHKIQRTSLMASGGIFILGLLISLWLARNISVPVRVLRDAARRVGQGDLTANINCISNDEIGDLGKAFNIMVSDISKAREELREINQTLSDTNQRLNTTLTDLKATQTQLIHAEKMASLGEMTAGIAHEIQNPLNFVNNFSEINSELVDELHDELKKGDMQSANEIARNIKENEEKIVFHGKRADSIVKSMLLHSRTGSGQKELTDLNDMVDEYVRLAYHGMRAKDKTFNVDFKTELDPELPKINMIPQDIGRVLLNLINNAFQALNSAPYPPEGGHKKSPKVSVITKHIPPLGGRGQNSVQISITDNGPGIPDSIKDKIFQPFFTTKPTGKGTGLGLSLSYDIINAHGGEIKVDSIEGEGTTFTIILPV